MKRLVPATLAALSLAACVTPTVYQPAAGPDAVGYSDYVIEPGRYRVTFHGGDAASVEQVMDLALLRAADIALAQGYDWFQISDRYIRGVGGGYGPTVSLGFGGMSYGSHSAVGGGVGAGYDFVGGPALAATIEVAMGRGPMPPGLNVYNARAIRSMHPG
jgi:hypothetical protein